MNELTINGFSAVSEEEMMMVDGGVIPETIIVSAAIGSLIGVGIGLIWGWLSN